MKKFTLQIIIPLYANKEALSIYTDDFHSFEVRSDCPRSTAKEFIRVLKKTYNYEFDEKPMQFPSGVHQASVYTFKFVQP